jgi:hypothetical protein
MVKSPRRKKSPFRQTDNRRSYSRMVPYTGAVVYSPPQRQLVPYNRSPPKLQIMDPYVESPPKLQMAPYVESPRQQEIMTRIKKLELELENEKTKNLDRSPRRNYLEYEKTLMDRIEKLELDLEKEKKEKIRLEDQKKMDKIVELEKPIQNLKNDKLKEMTQVDKLGREIAQADIPTPAQYSEIETTVGLMDVPKQLEIYELNTQMTPGQFLSFYGQMNDNQRRYHWYHLNESDKKMLLKEIHQPYFDFIQLNTGDIYYPNPLIIRGVKSGSIPSPFLATIHPTAMKPPRERVEKEIIDEQIRNANTPTARQAREIEIKKDEIRAIKIKNAQKNGVWGIKKIELEPIDDIPLYKLKEPLTAGQYVVFYNKLDYNQRNYFWKQLNNTEKSVLRRDFRIDNPDARFNPF